MCSSCWARHLVWTPTPRRGFGLGEARWDHLRLPARTPITQIELLTSEQNPASLISVHSIVLYVSAGICHLIKAEFSKDSDCSSDKLLWFLIICHYDNSVIFLLCDKYSVIPSTITSYCFNNWALYNLLYTCMPVPVFICTYPRYMQWSVGPDDGQTEW